MKTCERNRACDRVAVQGSVSRPLTLTTLIRSGPPDPDDDEQAPPVDEHCPGGETRGSTRSRTPSPASSRLVTPDLDLRYCIFIGDDATLDLLIRNVEGPGTRGAKESVNDSKDEDGSDVASTLSGLLAGLPTLAGPQRLASSLKQKFVSNSGAILQMRENH
ncbi:hypothetical protein DMN91_007379 [Ooceraea biroi]|uniref:Uncharacterized protein n=1 Tax=Ooceraea biroi TaxID=2015173 RepID=A0A3L8DK99_OOCBI|nr:hypothetical protein DMN91_007379 [Ooceraea biroi]